MIGNKSVKIYLVLENLIVGFTFWGIYSFFILPLTKEAVVDTSIVQIRVIKSHFLNIIIISSALIFLFDFYFLRADNALENNKKKIQEALKIDPNNVAKQGELKQVEKKRESLLFTNRFIFQVGFGIMIALSVYITFLRPIHIFTTPIQ